jgi:hypothetical protein
VDGNKYVFDLLWIGVPFADAANADPLTGLTIRYKNQGARGKIQGRIGYGQDEAITSNCDVSGRHPSHLGFSA